MCKSLQNSNIVAPQVRQKIVDFERLLAVHHSC